GRAPPPDSNESKNEHDERVREGVPERGPRRADREDSGEGRGMDRVPRDRASGLVEEIREVEGEPVMLAPERGHGPARFPVVEPRAEEDEEGESEPACGPDFSPDAYSGSAEKVERRFTPDHLEHGVVRDLLGRAARIEDHAPLSDLAHLRLQEESDAPGLVS